MQWLPIETAPKDGQTILVGVNGEEGWGLDLVDALEFEFAGDGWGITRNTADYTHWHPITPPPVGAE